MVEYTDKIPELDLVLKKGYLLPKLGVFPRAGVIFGFGLAHFQRGLAARLGS